jgi:predicted CxxxxCH...CXXCH cytochrome family protein
VACHSTAVLDWYGTTGLPTCSSCHVGSLDPVVINGSGTAGKHAVHVTSLNIPCAKCHSAYPDAASHMNGTLDTTNPAVSLVQFDAANPVGAWINDTGAQTGTCTQLNCHNNTNLDWYSTNTWTTPTECSTCHDAAVGTRRQVTGTGGDFGQESHHVINYSSRTTQIVTSTDCRVCHDMGNHTSGTIRMADKDTAGQVIVYQPSSPSSLEPFCLGCHDADGALTEAAPMTPFSDGNTLGTGLNAAGDKIESYWTNSNPTHKNRGLTCAGTGSPNTGCHGNNGAINMHGSPSRGLLTKNMTFPIAETAAYNANDYQLCFECHANYAAVTKEVVLGYKLGGNYDVAFNTATFSLPATPYYTSGIQTLFRDQYVPGDTTRIGTDSTPYNNNIGLPVLDQYTFMPLHNMHLMAIYTDATISVPNAFTWNYRNDPVQVGRITCTTCHNVHGTNGSIRNTYDEFVLERGTGIGSDLYTAFWGIVLYPPLNGPYPLTTYPMSCAYDCHGVSVQNNLPTTYWYSPSNE